MIPGFDELVDVYGYGSIGGGSVFGSTNQVSWDVLVRSDYRTEVTTDQSTVTTEGVESFVVDGSLYEVLDGTLSEVTDFMDPMISSNSSNQKIFDLDIWSYNRGDLSPAQQLASYGAYLNLSPETVTVNGVVLGPYESLLGGVLRHDLSSEMMGVDRDLRLRGTEGNDFGYVDTDLYPSSEVYWSPGDDIYQAVSVGDGYPYELYYDGHHFDRYVDGDRGGSEQRGDDLSGLSFAFDGSSLVVGSAYGETQLHQVDKIADSGHNDVLTSTEAEHRIQYRMNYGGIDVLETGQGRDEIRIEPRDVWSETQQVVIHSEQHGTVAVKAPSLSDDPNFSVTTGPSTIYPNNPEGVILTTQDLLDGNWESQGYAHDFDASAGDSTVAVVYEGMRIHPGRHEVIFQLYDLEGNKVGSEVLLGDSNPLWLAHVASGTMMRWPRFASRATHRTCTTSVRTGTWSPGARALMMTAVIRPSWVASTTRSPTFGATGLSSSIRFRIQTIICTPRMATPL